jgi:hypothetical protein
MEPALDGAPVIHASELAGFGDLDDFDGANVMALVIDRSIAIAGGVRDVTYMLKELGVRLGDSGRAALGEAPGLHAGITTMAPMATANDDDRARLVRWRVRRRGASWRTAATALTLGSTSMGT